MKTHQMAKTRFYNIWDNILRRTTNPKHPAYKFYSGRGITCSWKNFEEFKNDMYESYLKHLKKFGENETTIDRIDNNGNYCKENCRWATREQQANNRRTNKFLTYKNKTLSFSEWEKTLGLPKCILWQRITKYKWSIEKSLTTPSSRKIYA